MTLSASRTLETGAKFQHLRMLVHVEALRQFDSLSSDMNITEPLSVEYIIKGL